MSLPAPPLPTTVVATRRNGVVGALVRGARPMHWWKNLLLLVPAFTAHEWRNGGAVANALVALAVFSLVASAIYLLNDVFDAPADRLHPRKRGRPVASGALPVSIATAAAVVSLVAAGATAAAVVPRTLPALGIYVPLMVAYSAVLKRLVALDVVVLAVGYTLRLAAGAAAVRVPLSPWLAAFSMFVFLSLALLKRSSELHAAAASDGERLHGRGYQRADADAVTTLGMAMASIAVLVLALYVNAPEVSVLYRRPQVLWLLCPTVGYWQLRFWVLARRGVVQDDPVLFALRDPPSLCVLATCGALVLLAL